MKFHVYVTIPVHSLCPGQVICAHSSTGDVTGWEASDIPKILMTVDEVRRTIDGYEVFARPLSSPDTRRRTRLTYKAGHDQVLVEPSDEGVAKLLATLPDVMTSAMGRSAVLIGWSHLGADFREFTPQERGRIRDAEVGEAAERLMDAVMPNGAQQEAPADA